MPFFVAQTTFRSVQEHFSGFTCREPTLNPTNPNYRPSDWERDHINTFRNKPDTTELIGERDTSTG
jgi:hypothetical protein